MSAALPRPSRPSHRMRWAGLAVAAALPLAAHAGCTVVFGQGRLAAGDAETARQWDGVNLAFNGRVAQALAGHGEAVVALVARVEADVAASVAAMLARAGPEGCDRIVETTLFADDDAQALVARLREYPLEPGAAGLRIGAPRLVVEHQFDLGPRTLERVRPAALGERMAGELLLQRAAAPGR